METRNVLVLYSNNRLVPGNVEVDRGLRAAMVSSAERPVTILSEFLDEPGFGGEAYERTMTTYLREKYAARPPNVIVAVSDEAFGFLIRHREELFPNAPLVHAVVSKTLLEHIPCAACRCGRASRSSTIIPAPSHRRCAGTRPRGDS